MSDETTTTAAPAAAPEAISTPDITATDEVGGEILTDSDEEELELLVDGQKYKEKINWKDKDGLRKRMKEEFQKAKAFNSKSQKAAEFERKFTQTEGDLQSILQLLKENPMEVLRHPSLGIDMKKFIEDEIAREVEEASKSPEQLAQEKLTKENEDLKKLLADAQKAKDDQESQRIQSEVATKVHSDITAALDGGGLPSNMEAIKRVAMALKAANKLKINVTAAEVIPYVKKQIFEESRALSSMLKEEEYEEFLGEERIKAIAKKYYSRNKKPAEPTIPTPSSIQATGKDTLDGLFKPKAKTERVNPKMWAKNIEKSFGK